MSRTGSGDRKRITSRIALAFLVAVALILILWLPRSGLNTHPQPRILVLYCFSTMESVLEDGVLPAFREHWQRENDERVAFATTYSGSGDITGRIVERSPAEIAIVSSELDAHRLPVPFRSWRELPHRGVLVRTRMVIVAREGNPLELETFADLARPGVEIVHGDPVTSGAANLAILAEYGAELRRSGDPVLAEKQLLGIWRNVVVRSPNSRRARSRFDNGIGTALVTYEHDVVVTPSKPEIDGEIIIPPGTILAEPVVARIDKNIDVRQRPLVDAFVEFLWSREAQEILASYGFQSVIEDSALAALPTETFTLEDLGGARAARHDILEAVWKDRILPVLHP